LSANNVLVTWDAVSGATHYEVYWAETASGEYSLDGTPTSTSFTSTNWGANESGCFKIKAVNSAGSSGYSSIAFFGPYSSGGSAPSTPTGVTATAVSSSSITISWYSVSGATGYDVYRADSSYGSYSYIGYSTSTSYTDTGLSANTPYYYKVAAYNSYDESGQSSYTSATTSGSVPSTPTGVTATAVSSSSITVSWSSVSGATGYDVYRADSSYGSYSYIGYSTSTSYTDTGRSANTTYYYKVAAYNNYGTSGQSSYDYATTSSSTPSIGSSLTQGYWRDGEIYYSAQYYYFYATSGSLYTVFWNDYDGDGSKTGDIVVSAYWDSDNTSIFSEDSGYNGKTFTASKTGYVMLKVEPYDYYSSGTFAIKYQ
jgi:fibronectin type 3 domain-containing protein